MPLARLRPEFALPMPASPTDEEHREQREGRLAAAMSRNVHLWLCTPQSACRVKPVWNA